MRPSTAPQLPTALVFGILLAKISAQNDVLTLSDKQPINGFDTACTNAYNTPLTDCSNSDFAGQGCSNKCIGFLDSLQTTMVTSCAGTSAYDNTLIGLFLAGQGVHTLCSNVPSGGTSSSGSGAGNGQSQGQAGASVIEVQSAAGDTSTSTTTTSVSTFSTSTASTSSTPKAAATSSTSTSSSPQAAATSSTTTVVPTTVTPEATTTSVAVVGTTVVPASLSDTSTSTSHTKSSTSSSSTSTSTNNGNGGGTPLDIGSSAACHGADLSMWLFVSLAGSAGIIWLL